MEGFIQSGRRRVSLSQLQERAARGASALTSLNLGTDTTVALMLRNDIAFLEVLLATSQVGAYSVLINWHFTPSEVRQILLDSGATLLVTHSDLMGRVRPALPDGVQVLGVETPAEVRAAYRIAEADAWAPAGSASWDRLLELHPPATHRVSAPRGSIFYTSGSTGVPKGVKRDPVLPQHQRAYGEMRAQWFGFRRDMRTAMIGPMYHSVQLSYATASLSTNGRVFLLPRFDAEEVLRLIEAEQLTHLHLVPTMMSRLLQLPASVKRRYDLSSLEFVIHGAAPCAGDVKRRMIEWWGPCIYEYYGSTEAGMISRASSQDWLERPGTVGRAWPGRTLRIYSEDGHELPPGENGEVYTSLGLMPNFTYHNDDDKRGSIERDGLVTNGDIGRLDKDGYLYLSGRKIDLVISGGVNIYPVEIESVLATHPAVGDCAVFGVPDSEYGEVLAAAVQPVAGFSVTPEELLTFLGERLARFKLPRKLEFHPTLPRDDSGKIFKRVLREPYWREAPSA